MLRPLLRRPLAHATFSCLQLFFRDVDELQKAGINAADLAKLKAAGICTVKGVQMCTRKMLLNIKGISEAKVDKIKEAAAKLVDAGFITAMEYSARREKVIRITTGSAELDKLLGGAARRARVGHLLHVQADRATAASFPFVCLLRRYRDASDHRDLWRVPHRQDADLPHALRHRPAPAQHGRRQRQGRIRHRPPMESSTSNINLHSLCSRGRIVSRWPTSTPRAPCKSGSSRG